jgi:5-methyltetrahydrofolate--homocysteine methyltransferase
MPLVIDTDLEFDLEDLKDDIETTRATDRWNDAPSEIKDLFHELEWNIIEGEHTESVSFINTALEQDVDARTLISGPMATGIAEVGRRFKMDEYFLPEVMMSAKCMQAALEVLKPLILAEKSEEIGTVVVGTVQGDLHDIGKKIVAMMMEAAGFTVIDLGVTVTPDQFMEAIEEHNPIIVGFSALLTTTMNMQWETIKRITAEGKRENMKIFVGGAPISQNWCDKIGADAYAMDALVAVEKAKACVTNLSNMKGGDPELHDAMIAIDVEREQAKLEADTA